ncbi:uncharacterized protein LOC112906117 [Agrilus planipennis]|uniref:Uncharacterized protein LOC112906117 n=1 Tax=Agrilus planipennis TaxID=224129 RepID=A0A7F5RHU3_AGRPL|nr:uncharacterized protein LOC112906117 [Agrilus planipennis]
MLLSLEERIVKLSKTVYRPKPICELQLNTFTVVPHVIIFQNFTPGISYCATLSFLNNCEISKPLKNISEPSGYFTVTVSSSMYTTKVAPGMSQHYTVKFCAEEMHDYYYQLTFITEAESIKIPVIEKLEN